MFTERPPRSPQIYPRCVSTRNADEGLCSLILKGYTTNLLNVIVVSSLIFLLMASWVRLMT
jgi:hypothetical protein